MNSNANRIFPLDIRSRAKLTSSVRISSLNEVVIELIKNALDARARSIKVNLNYTTGFCSVADNGCGIPASEFSKHGKLSQEYCTSKTAAAKQVYGRYGQTLSRIAGVGLLCIISKASRDTGTDVLWCDEAGRIGDDTRSNEDFQDCIGTTVKVYNLFSKMPVRVKHIGQVFASQHEIRKEFNRLKLSVLGLILSCASPFEVDVKYSSPTLRYHYRPIAVRSLLLDVPGYRHPEAVRSGLRQAGYVLEQREAEWRQVSIQSGSIVGFATISTVALPHRDLQFISIDNKALSRETRPEIFARINSLFSASTFGSHKLDSGLNVNYPESSSESERGHNTKQRTRLKRIDQWPTFVIWLEDNDNVGLSEILYAGLLTSATESLLDRVASFLELLVAEFLRENGFSTLCKILSKSRPEILDAVKYPDMVPEYIDQAVKENFGYFSRLKSSTQTGNPEILDGLPFLSTECSHAFVPRTPEPEKLIGLDPDFMVSAQDDKISMPSTWENSEEQSMLWLDPKSGKYLDVDLRTGMVRPKVAGFGTENVDGIITSNAEARHSTGRVRTKTEGHEISHTARNIDKYFKKGNRLYNDPPRTDRANYVTAQGYIDAQRLRFNQMDQHGCLSRVLDCSVRVTKEALANVVFATQVDKKFILATVTAGGMGTDASGHERHYSILIDQHAADERCKVEDLLKSIHRGDSVHLQNPIRCELPDMEIQRLTQIGSYLEKLHVVAEISTRTRISGAGYDNKSRQLEIKALPVAIAERCRLNPRLAVDILREAIWSEHTANSADPSDLDLDTCAENVSPNSMLSALPSRMLDLVNSRACRSAIMFNDRLDDDQCLGLVHRLARCTLPFQCAHGRPSMVVVANLQQVTDTGFCEFDMSWKAHQALGTADRQRPASWLAQAYGQHGLNTVDSPSTPSFGNAYRSWAREDIF